MAITEPSNSIPDPLWAELDYAESKEQEELEAGYKEVEGWNAALLNQVAGLQGMGLNLIGRLGDGSDEGNPPFDMSAHKPTNSLLYLRPDTREKLYAQGELPYAIHSEGDPYTITGDVPSRAKKLIDDLIANTSSKLDAENSTPDKEIWHGDVAGQPVRFVKYYGVITAHGLYSTTESPTLSIRVYRE